MGKKYTPILLRLYEGKPKDALIIKGLESAEGHGAKLIKVKQILFQYFSAQIKPEKVVQVGRNVEGEQPQKDRANTDSSSHPLSTDSSSTESVEVETKVDPEAAGIKTNLKQFMSVW